MTLYKKLKAAGVEIDHHESDLYAPDTPETRRIIAEHGDVVLTHFVNQAPPHVGEPWVDIPFAYDPWWTSRAEKKN